MVLISLDCERGHGLRSVLPEDTVYIRFRGLEPVSRNEWPQYEHENVETRRPSRELQRVQEEARIARGGNHIRLDDQNSSADCFREGRSGCGPPELRRRRGEAGQSVKEHH